MGTEQADPGTLLPREERERQGLVPVWFSESSCEIFNK